MPIYAFQCRTCHAKGRVFRKIAERNEAPACCGTLTQRIIEAPAIQADLPSYQSPIDGRWIDGKRARTEDLKRNGCRPWEGIESERKEADRRLQEADHTFDQSLETALFDTYRQMGDEKQRALNAIA